MQKTRVVIGQSSGPMHLASLCRVPHAVWGHHRLYQRYADTWNPHKTVMEYHSCSVQFQISVDEATSLADRMCDKIEWTPR